MSDGTTKWESRPVLAGVVRVAVSAAPLAASVIAVIIAGRIIDRPASTSLAIVWWIGLTAFATGVLWLADKAMRKLLPVAALFKLSLVFPDRAPSRFKLAIRGGTVRQLQRQVESGTFSAATPQDAAEQLIGLAATLNAHDRLTRGHTERVRAYAVMIGQEMGYEGLDLELLNWSGLVHDIGKLAVPTEILNKPGKPTKEEWEVLRNHPAAADALIEPLRPWLGQWAESATQHHERFDGQGYPLGLSAGEITEAGRIVAVADAYDVMTSTRSYKKPMSAADARAELVANAGTQFDPDVVRAFLNIALGRLRLVMGPLSSLVHLPGGSASLGSTVVTGAGAMGAVAVAAVSGALPPAIQPVEPVPDTVAFTESADEEAPAEEPDPSRPTAFDLELSTGEDQSATMDIAGRYRQSITSIEVTDPPRSGRAIVSDIGIITFEPEADFHGTVQIGYRACFDDGSCDDGVITVTVTSDNDPPVAEPDQVTIPEDTAAVLDVLTNDSDVDDEKLTITKVRLLEDPSYALNPPGSSAKTVVDTAADDTWLVVTPPRNSWGRLLVQYTVSDPGGLTDTSTAVVTVTQVEDLPRAVDDVVTGYENTAINIDVLANDDDGDGDLLTITKVASIQGGAATTNGRVVTFTPHPRYIGAAGLTYTISDGKNSTTARVTIDIVDVTEQPLVSADTATVAEDRSIAIDVLANDVAVNETLNTGSVVIVRPPQNGSAVWNGTAADYTPTADWSGQDSFDYLVCNLLDFCNIATVTVTVQPVNDAPTLGIGPDQTVLEDAGPQTRNAWATSNPGPANEAAQTITYNVTNNNPTLFTTQPTITPSTNTNPGRLSYTPAPNANGTATITITAIDNGGTTNSGTNTSTARTATITITPVNDGPTLGIGPDETVLEDASPQTRNAWATSNPGPANEAAQTITYNVTNNNPTLFTTQPTITPSTNTNPGRLSYTPAPNANGTATITITAIDNGGTTNSGTNTSTPRTATITITPVNDIPVAVDDTQSVDEDDVAGISFSVLANDSDADGDTVQYATADLTTIGNGTITDNADGTFDYVPDEHFNGTETFGYTVIDGNGGSDSATVTVTVNPIPDVPVAGDDSGITLIDTPLSVAAPGLLANDYDVDGESLTVITTPVTPPANGSLTLGTDGSYLYTPNASYVGTDTFTYRVSDPGGSTATAVVTITIDSGAAGQTYYLGDSGSSSWLYDLVTTAPAASTPPFDSDGNGDPGLTIDNSNGSEFEFDPTKYQLWSMTAASPIELDGPVTLDLWATVKNYDLDKEGHPYIYLYDCLGFSCTKLAETDVHINDWAMGTADFVGRQIDLGSVTHTVPTGRSLVLKLLFKHQDMWVAMSTAQPSALQLTLANQAPVANDDPAAVDEDSGTTNLTVLANDTDTDLDPTSVSITGAATLGTATPVGDGTIDYTPNADANGVDTFTYQVCDLGSNCDTATVTVTITAINDRPTFTGGGGFTAAGVGPSTVPGWATAIDAGAADESGQVLTFGFTFNDNPGLFNSGPTVDPVTGDLTFDAAGSGIANVTLVLSDDGGTANGGLDTSAGFTFTITVP